MKNVCTFYLLLMAALFATAVYGQKSALRQSSLVDKTDVPNPTQPAALPVIKIRDAKISSSGEGVLIQWNTEQEVNNLGFNIYRFDAKRQNAVLINESIVAGSALITADKIGSASGYSYSFFDIKGSLDNIYRIETVNLSGKTESFGDFEPVYEANLHQRIGANSKTLDELSKTETRNEWLREYPNLDDKMRVMITGENQPIDAPKIAPSNLDTQKWIAAQPGAKIGVKQDGFYRITRAELQAAGFNVNAPVELWQLYTGGIEQPLIVPANGDYIEFYGRGLDTVEADTRIYYAVIGSSAGLRMATSFPRSKPSQVVTRSYLGSVERKDRTAYSSGVLNGEAGNFFGAVVGSTAPANLAMNLKAIDTNAAEAIVEISVQGLTITPHSVQVKLNHTIIATLEGSDRALMQQNVTVPVSLLNEGANTVSLIEGNSGYVSLVDVIRISYARRFQAEQNRLTFTTAYGRTTQIEGFTTENVRVFDITDPNRTALVSSRIQGSAGAFRALISPQRSRVMFAVADNVFQTPASITSNAPSNVLETAQNKNLIIVSHANWMAEAQSLATYRRNQGLTVEVVNVEDIFDETGYGTSSTQAIKSFFQVVQPQYALLFGDGTYDYKNYFNRPFQNFVPTKLIDTIFTETSSDEPLGDFNEDYIADFPIGRLPVNSAATAQLMVNKIMTFEQSVGTALSQRGGVFVCDNPDPIPNSYDFCASNQRLINRLPAGTPTQIITRADGDVPTVRQSILNSINSGRYLVVYTGHGTVGSWANGFFRTDDTSSLNNAPNYNLFLAMNCLNGAFAEATTTSLAEGMLNAQNGGSVAAWTSSGLTFPDSQEFMSARFFTALANAEFARIGEAVRASKQATFDRDVRLTWILFSDPTLKIR